MWASAGAKVEDFSTLIGSLKARRGDWESSAKEAISGNVEKKSVVEEIASGKVKENLEKFVFFFEIIYIFGLY